MALRLVSGGLSVGGALIPTAEMVERHAYRKKSAFDWTFSLQLGSDRSVIAFTVPLFITKV